MAHPWAETFRGSQNQSQDIRSVPNWIRLTWQPELTRIPQMDPTVQKDKTDSESSNTETPSPSPLVGYLLPLSGPPADTTHSNTVAHTRFIILPQGWFFLKLWWNTCKKKFIISTIWQYTAWQYSVCTYCTTLSPSTSRTLFTVEWKLYLSPWDQ